MEGKRKTSAEKKVYVNERLKHQSPIKRSSIGRYYGHQFNTRFAYLKHARTYARLHGITLIENQLLANSKQEREGRPSEQEGELKRRSFVALSIPSCCLAPPNASTLIIYFAK